MKRSFLLCAALALLTLTGCADHWVKPGTTPADLKTDLGECQARGRWRYPPVMVWQMIVPGEYVPPHEVCTTDSQGRTSCYLTGGIVQEPVWGEVDANQAIRYQETSGCMKERGWSLAQ